MGFKLLKRGLAGCGGCLGVVSLLTCSPWVAYSRQPGLTFDNLKKKSTRERTRIGAGGNIPGGCEWPWVVVRAVAEARQRAGGDRRWWWRRQRRGSVGSQHCSIWRLVGRGTIVGNILTLFRTSLNAVVVQWARLLDDQSVWSGVQFLNTALFFSYLLLINSITQ
jgi:hypothetical protein